MPEVITNPAFALYVATVAALGAMIALLVYSGQLIDTCKGFDAHSRNTTMRGIAVTQRQQPTAKNAKHFDHNASSRS